MEEKLSHEERKALAFKLGKKYSYLICPLCGKSKPMKTWKGKTVFDIDDDPEIIQFRMCRGGRGIGGFYKNEDESIFLSHLKEKNPELLQNLNEQLGKLLNKVHVVIG